MNPEQEEMYRCDKLNQEETFQCNVPATKFYLSEGMLVVSCRCDSHNIIAYKPELGSLWELTREEYVVALVMGS